MALRHQVDLGCWECVCCVRFFGGCKYVYVKLYLMYIYIYISIDTLKYLCI